MKSSTGADLYERSSGSGSAGKTRTSGTGADLYERNNSFGSTGKTRTSGTGVALYERSSGSGSTGRTKAAGTGAVLYARCSTEEESQKNALLKQVEEAKAVIALREWRLIRSYVESKSGTTIKGRTQFQQLFDDLIKDDFDIIVIKSQDRLMRNTKDWYLFLDRMQSCGKKLFIYLENRFYSSDDSILSGIKAILAEEYSRELSKKINNAHRNRQQRGDVVVITNKTFGYQKRKDKQVEIYEPEAFAVRKIFQLCAEGYGSRKIRMILENEGLRRKDGRAVSETAVRRVIRNPLYMGTAVMNKAHFDFNTKKVMKNPQSEWIFHKNAVPSIVSEKLWQEANHAMDQRSAAGKTSGGYRKGSNPGKHDLSGKLVCGLCGGKYYKTFRRRQPQGAQVIEWKCSTYLCSGRESAVSGRKQMYGQQPGTKKGCDNIHLEEQKLYALLSEVFWQQEIADYPQIVKKALQMMKKTIQQTDFSGRLKDCNVRLENLSRQMDVLLDKLLEGTISDAVFKKKFDSMKQEEEEIREKIDHYETSNMKMAQVEKRLKQMEEMLLEDDIKRQIVLAQMIDNIHKIEVYPEYLMLYFHTCEMTGVHCDEVKWPKTEVCTLRVDIGVLFSSKRRIEKQKKEILELIRENPKVTAKELAKELEINKNQAIYRLDSLKKENKIRFCGKGGRGYWEICK